MYVCKLHVILFALLLSSLTPSPALLPTPVVQLPVLHRGLGPLLRGPGGPPHQRGGHGHDRANAQEAEAQEVVPRIGEHSK